jgi:tryptophan-rich sensory protein
MADPTLELPSPRKNGAIALAAFLGLAYLVAAVSSIFTVSSIPTWYAALAKPSFNPPNQLFGPVWTLLYTLMAIAAWLVWRRPDSSLRRAGLLWFGMQLGLNFLWSFVFFWAHQIGLALMEIALLWVGILATMLIFFRLGKAAGWMFAPYLAWVSFAAVLNFAIWRLN